MKAVLNGVGQQLEVENEKGYFEILYAPYVRGFSEGLQRRLRRLQVGLVPKTGDTIYSHLCKLKEKSERQECKDVVYSVPCGECGVRYIGETGQHFCERRSQHQRDIASGKTTNGFCNHVVGNKGHKIDWEKVIFLDHEKHWERRKI